MTPASQCGSLSPIGTPRRSDRLPYKRQSLPHAPGTALPATRPHRHDKPKPANPPHLRPPGAPSRANAKMESAMGADGPPSPPPRVGTSGPGMGPRNQRWRANAGRSPTVRQRCAREKPAPRTLHVGGGATTLVFGSALRRLLLQCWLLPASCSRPVGRRAATRARAWGRNPTAHGQRLFMCKRPWASLRAMVRWR